MEGTKMDKVFVSLLTKCQASYSYTYEYPEKPTADLCPDCVKQLEKWLYNKDK